MSSHLKDKIINNSLWYVDWNTNGPPKTLKIDDWDNLAASDKFFARKFDNKVDERVIEKVIERVRD